eukprot:Platyproteum_vivax@DN2101_c0_g1_i1.p1
MEGDLIVVDCGDDRHTAGGRKVVKYLDEEDYILEKVETEADPPAINREENGNMSPKTPKIFLVPSGGERSRRLSQDTGPSRPRSKSTHSSRNSPACHSRPSPGNPPPKVCNLLEGKPAKGDTPIANFFEKLKSLGKPKEKPQCLSPASGRRTLSAQAPRRQSASPRSSDRPFQPATKTDYSLSNNEKRNMMVVVGSDDVRAPRRGGSDDARAAREGKRHSCFYPDGCDMTKHECMRALART